MGDIALPDGGPVVAHTPIDDEELEMESVERLLPNGPAEHMSADAPEPTKYNATFQLDLEKLKQEVYNEGLQVEEEGLTDIIRKKTKLPSAGAAGHTTGQPLTKASGISNNDVSLVSWPKA